MFVMIIEKITKYFITRQMYLIQTNHHKYIIYQSKHMFRNNNSFTLENRFITLYNSKEVSKFRNTKKSFLKIR